MTPDSHPIMHSVPSLNPNLAANFKGAAQRIRVMTESWLGAYGFCPSCGNSLKANPANTPVADFICTVCVHDYELKSKAGTIGRSLADGAYSTMMQRLRSDSVPSLFVLSYDRGNLAIKNLTLVPSHFFRPELIQCRKPLSEHARRAGWVGCNILFGMIPLSALIPIVTDGLMAPRSLIKEKWHTISAFSEVPMSKRGWLHDVLSCIERLPKEFKLSDVYQFSTYLKRLHPRNANVEPKIRQQLQVLRDLGSLEFLGNGRYRRLID